MQETPYNEGNKKVLVFSAFADTVEYLYKNLAGEMLQYGVYTAREQRKLRFVMVTTSLMKTRSELM